ncbi:hypothetical protein JCM16303_000745 [Sporobolomyces ruberrimus]
MFFFHLGKGHLAPFGSVRALCTPPIQPLNPLDKNKVLVTTSFLLSLPSFRLSTTMLGPAIFASLLLIGSDVVSAIPTLRRPTFKERPRTALITPNGTSNCVPSFGNDTMYHIFARGNGKSSTHIPHEDSSPSGDSSKGGTVFVSGTDSPEDGAYYFLPVSLPLIPDNSTVSTAMNGTMTSLAFRLNLADQPMGQHCVVAQNGRVLTTGSCENDDSIFVVTCSTCPSPADESTTPGKIGSTCRIRAILPAMSSAYCTSWNYSAGPIPGVPGYGAVGMRKCKDGMKGQEWDIVEA